MTSERTTLAQERKKALSGAVGSPTEPEIFSLKRNIGVLEKRIKALEYVVQGLVERSPTPSPRTSAPPVYSGPVPVASSRPLF